MKNRHLIVVLLIAVLALTLAACDCGPQVTNSIVNGTTTQPTGDWYTMWSNNATDMDVFELTNGYGTVIADQGGELRVDTTTTLEDFSRDVVTIEYDGEQRDTIQYTFELKKDLKYSDGTPINAYDYAFSILYFSSWVVSESGGNATYGYSIVGFEEFRMATEQVSFKGVTLDKDNEYIFSIIINPDELPYYFELAYAGVSPYPMHMWLKDCGVTIELDGDGHPMFSENFYAASNKQKISDRREFVRTGTWTTGYIGSGPYKLVEFNKSALRVTLEINPHYNGNFEGRKAKIQKVIILYVPNATLVASLKNGTVDLLANVTSGADINAADAVAKDERNNVTSSSYLRNGYGYLSFVCDYGPTQFVEVRKAIAHLIDRVSFATEFTGGHGSVVHGPYGLAMWMYQDNSRLDSLNKYAYSTAAANMILEEGGWIYDAQGNPWSTGAGMRYKNIKDVKVNGPWLENEQGKLIDNEGNLVTKDEDRVQTQVDVSTIGYTDRILEKNNMVLMPLEIDYCGSAGSPVTEMVNTKLVQSQASANVGFGFRTEEVTFEILQDRLQRKNGYDFATACMYNLATGFQAIYDQSYSWSGESSWYNAYYYNNNRLFDLGEGGLDQLSMDMVYKCEPSQKSEYLRLWTDYIIRWNDLLPELPLYSNIYYDFYNVKLENYEPNPLWQFRDAIVYANVTGF